MTYRIRRHVDVEGDLIAIAKWIARDSRDAAVRFLSAAEDTILSLGHLPERGSLKPWRGTRFAGVRTWAIRGFPNHLVVYRVQRKDVFVLTVVHGSRNYHRIVRGRA